LHNIFVIKFLDQSRDDFGFIFIKKSVQDNPPFLKRFAAMFAGAGIFTVNDFVSDASRFITSRTNDHDFASVDRHFLIKDTALRRFDIGFGMAFDFVDIFDNDLSLFREGGDDFTLLAFIFAGEDNDGIAFFDI